MHTPSSAARVLVASDDFALADEITRPLKSHFDQVDRSTNPELANSDFDTCNPDVLVLGFQGLGKSFRYYLGLHQPDRVLHRHRVILLCSKEELPAAFGLCKNLCFDDYVLYWPFTHDGLRLPMSIRLAYREMMGMSAESERAAALLAHVAYVEEHERRAGHGSSADMGKMAGAHSSLLELEHELVGAGVAQPHVPVAKESLSVPSAHGADQSSNPASRAWLLAGNIRGDRPLLLVVEDDQPTQRLIARLLDSERYDALFVCDAIDALYNLKFWKPHVIFMDVGLPGMNGVSLTQYLKATPHLANIPIIMMTGDSRSETFKKSVHAGASDFLAKPFTRETLMAKLRTALAR
jgi:CheY-like chemotaxis protein